MGRMHEETRAKVMVGADMSDEFAVEIGLRQGSARSPLLFIVVLELISRKREGDVMEKLLYADDLALLAENAETLEVLLNDWKTEFERHGLKINVDKTEMMKMGEQHEEMNISLVETRLNQVSSFTYLDDTVAEDRSSEK